VKALGHSANETANWIVDHGGVVTVPGTAFGPSGEGYLRLSCAVSVDTLERALEGIKKAIGKI
jgi:aspartate/methionine/tyrosine aminotransferase